MSSDTFDMYWVQNISRIKYIVSNCLNKTSNNIKNEYVNVYEFVYAFASDVCRTEWLYLFFLQQNEYVFSTEKLTSVTLTDMNFSRTKLIDFAFNQKYIQLVSFYKSRLSQQQPTCRDSNGYRNKPHQLLTSLAEQDGTCQIPYTIT